MVPEKIYFILLITEFILAGIVFASLFFIRAPYGRHVRSGWGPRIPARYAWIAMEFPAILVIALIFVIYRETASILSLVFLGMWELHYLYRTFAYPLLMRGGDKGFPALIAFFAFIFNIINGYINGMYLFKLADPVSASWFYDPRFIIGALLFLSGLIIHVHSDHVLRTLRKPGETDYRIPDRGLHRYVSSPNYFGEIVEWTGWAVATWSLPGLVFSLFTTANLLPRARTHHAWYVAEFREYPPERKAVIPFIY